MVPCAPPRGHLSRIVPRHPNRRPRPAVPQSATAAAARAPEYPFCITERVRWEDVDLVGITRYSAFTRMLDVAEQELWREAGMTVLQVMDEFNIWLPRRNLQIDFLAPARFDDLLELRAGVSTVGTTSLTLRVEVWSADGAAHHATVTVVIVAVSAQGMVKQALPDSLRERVERYRVSD